MALKIIENENKEIVNKIRQKIKERNGHCPCSIFENDDTICMCKDFREQATEGLCHCKLYKKVIVED